MDVDSEIEEVEASLSNKVKNTKTSNKKSGTSNKTQKKILKQEPTMLTSKQKLTLEYSRKDWSLKSINRSGREPWEQDSDNSGDSDSGNGSDNNNYYNNNNNNIMPKKQQMKQTQSEDDTDNCLAKLLSIGQPKKCN